MSQNGADSDPGLTGAELSTLVERRLADEGHTPEAVAELAERIVKATTDRLVLLVPHQAGNVGYEVRSLQEFLAARAITRGDGPSTLAALRLTAPSAHWRNTFLLASGRVFTEREYLRPQLVGLLRELDSTDTLQAALPTGPHLAFELLDDDLALRSPALRRQLVQHALDVLNSGPSAEMDGHAVTLNRIGSDTTTRPLVEAALTRAISGPADAQATAYLTCCVLARQPDPLGARARQLVHTADLDLLQRMALWDRRPDLLTTGDPDPQGSRYQVAHQRLGEWLRGRMPISYQDEPGRNVVEALLLELDTAVATVVTAGGRSTTLSDLAAARRIPERTGATAVLETPVAADLVAGALLAVATDDWSAYSAVRQHLAATRQHLAVDESALSNALTGNGGSVQPQESSR